MKISILALVIRALQVVQCTKNLPVATTPATPKWKSHLGSVSYHVEVTDHRRDFSVNAMAYFSSKRNAYRYDFKGGSKLFIYPKEGIAYYYYPKSDFSKEKFNETTCAVIRTKVLTDLHRPFPAWQGFTNLGVDSVRNSPSQKFKKRSEDDSSIAEEQIWVANKYPIKQEIKQWLKDDYGAKRLLRNHVTREYYGYVTGEQHPSVWDRPKVNANCTSNSFVASTASSMVVDICVPSKLIAASSVRVPLPTRQKGRRTPPPANYFTARALNEDPLLLERPWFLEDYQNTVATLPKSFDWRDLGAVTPVKNQRQCGNCWALAAAGSLEGAYFVLNNQLIALSDQALTDCAGSTLFGRGLETDGCFGGIERSGFTWVHRNGGIPPAEEYTPFLEGNGNCTASSKTKLVAQLDGYYHIQNETDALKVALVKLGPIAVSIDSNGYAFTEYAGGVIKDCNRHYIDHAVLLVGYGESAEDGPYWIIKNTWDVDWGLQGYGLISAKGNCRSILDEAYFPVLHSEFDNESF